MRTNRNLIEFDDTVVRRHPMTEADRADLPAIALRHEAAREAGLPVPRVLSVKPDHLVLERASGTPLLQSQLSDTALQRVGREIAEVLRVLRGVTDWPLPVQDWTGLWTGLHRCAGSAATARAEAVASGVHVTLTHGDLSGGNLLVSAAGELCAVIDWDGATLADPAQDFHAACVNVPVGAADEIRACTPDREEFQRRADAYIATWADQHRLWVAGRHPWIN